MSNKKVVKDFSNVFLFTAICSILGFFRETIIAKQFGVGYQTDIFYFSLSIISIIMLGIGAGLANVFIPMFIESLQNKSKEEANDFANNVLNIIIIISLISVVFLYIFMKKIISLLAPGFAKDTEIYMFSVLICRISITSLIFNAIKSVFLSIAQANKEFRTVSYSNLLLNGILVAWSLVTGNKFGILGLTIINVLAFFIQMISYIPMLKKVGFKYKFTLNIKDENIIYMVKLLGPVLISSSANQINMLADKTVASMLGAGSIAILNFSGKISNVIYVIIGTSISTVVYSSLASFKANNNLESYEETLSGSIRISIFIMLPIVFGTIILRNQIVSLLFEGGNFNERDVSYTATVLAAYAPTILFFSMKDLLNKAFYSIHDTRVPMLTDILSVVINVTLNILLSRIFGISGLAAATSLASVVTTVVLFLCIKRKIHKFNYKKVLVASLKSLVSCFVMLLTIMILNYIVKQNISMDKVTTLIYTFIIIIIGAASYLFTSNIIRSEEYKIIMNYLNKSLKLKLKR